MSDKPSRPLSLRKAGAAASAPAGVADGPRPSPPQFVKLAAGALVLSGLAAIIASATTYSATEKGGWLRDSAIKANGKLKTGDKNKLSDAKLIDRIESTPKNLLISSVVVSLALLVLAFAVYRGKYWARWTTLGLWVMATLTTTLVGIQSITIIVSPDVGASFKVPAFVASLAFVLAVVLVNMRPCTEYFKLNKPVVAAGATPRRGLFAPRPAAQSAKPARGTTTRAVAAGVKTDTKAPAADRSRSKQRSSAESAAKGADLARARAKAASKSRRTGA